MDKNFDPVRPADDSARAIARTLMLNAASATLATLERDGHPSASLVSFALEQADAPFLLVSRLSSHTTHLLADPRCSLLVGETGKGDPLAHPRITVHCLAHSVARPSAENDALRTLFLSRHPKAALYIDFADFLFVRLSIIRASLNGGFGKAFRLQPDDFTAGP